MSYEPPTPPATLSTEIVDTLNGYSPEQLQDVARYAEALAEHKAREARLEEESDDEEIETTHESYREQNVIERRDRLEQVLDETSRRPS